MRYETKRVTFVTIFVKVTNVGFYYTNVNNVYINIIYNY